MTISTSFAYQSHLSNRLQYRHNFEFGCSNDSSERHDDPILLQYGMPHDGLFPIDSVTFNAVDTPFQTYRGSKRPTSAITATRKSGHADVSTYLQYGLDFGSPALQKIIKEIARTTHLPNYKQWDSVVSFGTGDGVYKVFDVLLDPGDTVLVEQFTFVPTLSSITCFGAQLVPVKLNLYGDGIDVEAFERLLVNWESLHPEKKFPKCIYTIPTGHNPIGTTQTLETRQQIYALCSKYSILIVEDDPYGFIALAQHDQENPFDPSKKLTNEQFLSKYVPTSYIELDDKGLVIRMDSFSKVFAPGLRIGSITAHETIIDHIRTFISISCKQPSGLSELAVVSIYERHFGGIDGWIQWLIKLSYEYTERKQAFINELRQSLLFKSKKIHILEPHHGMFVSVQFNFKQGADVEKALLQIEKIGLKRGVVGVLGTRLSFDKDTKKVANFIRLALSYTENKEELIEGAKRFIASVEEYFENEEN